MTKITRMIVPSNKKNHPNQKLKAINYITIHNTGNYNPTADALNHAKYLNNGSGGKQVSFHYAVDNKSIYQMFEDNSRCWHAGDGTNGTGNAESIGIEICVHDKAGFVKACENAAELTASLLKKHGLKIDRVKQHNNWSGKDCPKEIRAGTWGITWSGFIKLVENALSPPKPVAPAKPTPTKQYEITATKTIAGDPNSVVAKLKADGYKVTVKEVAGKTGGSTSAQPKLKSIDVIAREVINGAWGNGTDRKKRLTDAGHDYAKVQAEVNKLV